MRGVRKKVMLGGRAPWKNRLISDKMWQKVKLKALVRSGGWFRKKCSINVHKGRNQSKSINFCKKAPKSDR